jgi:hypothetical protein
MPGECGCGEDVPRIQGACVHYWKESSDWWETRRLDGIDTRDLYRLAKRYLPEEIAFDLGFASTASAFFYRLRNLFEERAHWWRVFNDREKNDERQSVTEGHESRARKSIGQ